MEGIMRKFFYFIYNTEIDIVEKIFKDKVRPEIFNDLIEKKEECKIQSTNNLHAWVIFINSLDADHSEVLFDYFMKYPFQDLL